MICCRVATLPILLAVLRTSCSAGADESTSIVTPPATETLTSVTSPPPSQSPRAVASAAVGVGCRYDNTSGVLHVRPPTCAFGQQLTVEFLSSTRCPLYRCEVARDAEPAVASLPAPQPPLTSALSNGCPHSEPPPESCPGLQVVKTLLEPRPGFGWCLSRRCSCPDFDPVIAACAADNRTRPLLAIEKSTGCRVLIECRLTDATAEGGERRASRCPQPSVPICGEGVEPERLRMPPLGCPLYRCPQPGSLASALPNAANANSTATTSVAGMADNSSVCPPPSPCPRGSVSVQQLSPPNNTTNAPTAASECPRRAKCEDVASAPPRAPCPDPGCAPGELAVPLLSATTTGRILNGGAACPAVACLGLRVPPWLPVCPGAPRFCSIADSSSGGSRSGLLRTELSITDFGALCVRVVCQPLSHFVWHWGHLTLEQEEAAIPFG